MPKMTQPLTSIVKIITDSFTSVGFIGAKLPETYDISKWTVRTYRVDSVLLSQIIQVLEGTTEIGNPVINRDVFESLAASRKSIPRKDSLAQTAAPINK